MHPFNYTTVKKSVFVIHMMSPDFSVKKV